jgi:mitofilin
MVAPVASESLDPATPPPQHHQPKQSGFFRSFILYTFGFGTLTYAGGVWYSLKDDDFHDQFTTYVPFADFVITKIEDSQLRYSLKDSDRPAAPRQPLPGRHKIVSVGKDSIVSREVPKERLVLERENDSKPKVTTAAPASPGSGDKRADVTLPLIRAPSDLDPLLASSVQNLNNFIQSINKSNIAEESVGRISRDIVSLSHALAGIREQHKEELRKSLAAQANKFASLGEATRDEVHEALEKQRTEFVEQFKAEEQRLIDLYNNRLQIEIEATKKAVVQHANNRLIAQRAELEREFARDISYRVDAERDGRLAGLDELSKAIDELTELAVSSGNAYDDYEKVAKFHLAVGSLASVIQTRSEPVPLGPYLKQIALALPDDPIVTAVIKSIPKDVSDEGVLGTSQLAARFRLLEPELRKASLLPPDAGVAGHVGSWLFSKLLWKKSGNPVGDDVESVIARAETALSEGRVIDAVAEVNSLKGWPKKLAGDWLVEARKRSEAEFLVSVLTEEGRLWSFSDVANS